MLTGDKQTQKAGDNSQQIQAQNIYITNGIEEKRAREIFQEMFAVARRDMTQEAYEIAKGRVEVFENMLIPKIEKIEGAINAFADPGFQFELTSAHKTAAASTRKADLELLSELLVHRIERKDNKNVCAGISKAIEVIDDIADDALRGLTVAFCVEQFGPISGNIKEGLAVLNSLYKNIGVDDLPKGDEWLDHLDILNVLRFSTTSSLKPFEEFMVQKLSGYSVFGINKESADYKTAIELLKDSQLPVALLCDHEWNKGFVRLSIVDKSMIESIDKFYDNVMPFYAEGQMVNGQRIVSYLIPEKLWKKQKNALENIYTLCNETRDDQRMTNQFNVHLEEFPYLKKVQEWWNNIPAAFQITAVGRIIANANAKILDKGIPNMD